MVELVLAVSDVLGLTPGGAHARPSSRALLHDVGKIRIPKTIIQKPGPLTPEERRLIETHTVEGERILTASAGRWPRSAPSSARATSGTTATATPTASPASEIPLVARIVCCCDAFNAMTTERPYRAALSAAAAVGRAAGMLGHAVRPARRRGGDRRARPPRRGRDVELRARPALTEVAAAPERAEAT